MSGWAEAVFTCGAQGCNTVHETNLTNDGWYTYFDTPDGWHIELSDYGSAIVRCPSHCEFVGTSLAAGGSWKDSP